MRTLFNIIIGEDFFLTAVKNFSSPGAGGAHAYSKNEEHVDENEAMGMELNYFTEQYGFSYFSVSKTEITVKFVTADGATIYQYTRNKH